MLWLQSRALCYTELQPGAIKTLSTQNIQTRRDLARHLQAQMLAARFAPPNDADETAGRTLVKTYLLEAHALNGDGGEAAYRLLEEAARRIGLTAHSTQDSDLVLLRSEHHELWCDTSLGRFWRLHTAIPVKEADGYHDTLVAGNTKLDKVWLPPKYLETLNSRTGGLLQTFSLNHDRRPMHATESESHDFDFVTLRLWASRAAQMLDKLRTSDVFHRGMSVRSVRIRTGDLDPDGDFTIAEYFHHGKVSAKGTSFDEHNRMTLRVLNDYRELVEGIERQYGLGIADRDADGCTHVQGEPITIKMDWTVDDLEYVVTRMFASVEPFRLWGVPHQIADQHYRVRAVDLHVGDTLTFDITPRHIVIQLPKGACGNTVVRFLGSLQYHVNSEVGADLLN